jgi:hypothetical protein
MSGFYLPWYVRAVIAVVSAPGRLISKLKGKPKND